jgi:hypothetical protein
MHVLALAATAAAAEGAGRSPTAVNSGQPVADAGAALHIATYRPQSKCPF